MAMKPPSCLGWFLTRVLSHGLHLLAGRVILGFGALILCLCYECVQRSLQQQAGCEEGLFFSSETSCQALATILYIPGRMSINANNS